MAKNGNIHPTRIFKTPEDLLNTWKKYKEDLKNKSKEWPKIQYVGKDGKRKVDYPVLPLTLEGLYRYCWENKIGTIEQYFTNHNGYYDEFVSICARIKQEIREQQITGGMIGFYNPSITQRLNGLVEKTESKINVEQPLFGDEEG
jgi:hypothetical protein